MTAPVPSVADRHDPYAALRVPPFRWFVISLLAMTIAVQIQAIAVAWQLYTATRDPLALGLSGLAEVLPFLALVLPAGHWADRHDRRWLSLVGIAVLVLCAAMFLAMTIALRVRGDVTGSVGTTGWSSPLAIYAVLAVSGVSRAILQPARQALGTMIVPASLYANAATWRSSIWQFASVLGPAIGGLMFAFVGPLVTYAVVLAMLVLSWWAMSLVRVPAPAVRQPQAPAGDGAAAILEGVRFVLRDRLVLAALSLDLFAVLFGGATALLPVFTSTVLHVSPEWLGYLRAAPAVGAVTMALLIAHQPPMTRAGRTLLMAVGTWGLSIIGFALSRNVWLSCALLAMGGAVDSVSVVIRSTLLQARTPAHLMGRVMAVNSIFIGSANEIGAFESGVTARLFGAVNSVLLGGAATLAVVVSMAVGSPRLRRLRRLDDEPPVA